MSATNPFVILSYVGGPALLTNATGLFVLSTSNRFARAIDRARALAGRSDGSSEVLADLREAWLHDTVALVEGAGYAASAVDSPATAVTSTCGSRRRWPPRDGASAWSA